MALTSTGPAHGWAFIASSSGRVPIADTGMLMAAATLTRGSKAAERGEQTVTPIQRCCGRAAIIVGAEAASSTASTVGSSREARKSLKSKDCAQATDGLFSIVCADGDGIPVVVCEEFRVVQQLLLVTCQVGADDDEQSLRVH